MRYRMRMNWIELKLTLGRVVGLDKDALHIYAGLLVQLAGAFVMRRSLGDRAPWLGVILAIAINEWLDLRAEIWPDRWQQYRASIHDVINTMVLPTLLLLLVRYLRSAPAFEKREGDSPSI